MDNEDVAYKPGDILAGKYRVDRTIGLGGFGAVLAATHLQLEESVAIKVLLPHAAKNPAASERFLREARAAVRIRSEHVARVSDVGQLPDTTPYMVMEFLQGQDLSSLLKTQGGQAIHDVAEWVLQACEALAEAHSLGIVHRDLKPANLFLTHKVDGVPCVKVLDFGISKLTNEGADKGMTKTSDVMGSPFYMSPEQMRSTRSVDARSDIWALGAIIYELLAGAPPFDAETMTALVVSIMQEPPRELSMFRRDIPPAMRDIIMTCLQKDPSRRYPDVASLAQALAPFAPQRAQTNVARVLAVSGGGAHRLSNPTGQPVSGQPISGGHAISGPQGAVAEGANHTMASMPASVAFASSGPQHTPSSPPNAQSGPIYTAHAYAQSGFVPPPPTQPGTYSASHPALVPPGAAPLVASGASPAQSWGGTYMGKKQGSSKTAMIVGISAVAIALIGAGGGALYLSSQSKSSSKVDASDVAASHEKKGDDKDKAASAPPASAQPPSSEQPVAQSTAIATVTPSAIPVSTQPVAVTPTSASSHASASADPKKPGTKPKDSANPLPPPPVGPPPGPPPVVTLPPPPAPPPPPSKPKPPPDTLFGRPD